MTLKSSREIKDIKKGLYTCMITRECSTCPYYIWYYNDDINEPGDRSCWGILYKDVVQALTRLEIMTDEEE